MSRSFRRYFALFDGYRIALVGFFALSIAQVAVVVPVPFLIKRVFDTALGDERVDLLIGLALVIFGLQVLSSSLGLLASRTILRISANVVSRLRMALFDRLYALSIRFHETNPVGDTHDRVVHETDRVELMTRAYSVLVPSAIFAVGIVGVLVFIDAGLFLVTFAFLPIVYGINRAARRVMQRLSRRQHAGIEAFSRATLGSLHAMRETRILGAESQTRAGQDAVLTSAAEHTRRAAMMNRVYIDSNRIAVAAWVTVILVVGGVGVVNGDLTIGELFAFYAGLALIRQPIDQMIAVVPIVVAGQEARRRVFDVLDLDQPRPYSGGRRLDIDGHLRLDHVTFEYDEGQPVLRDLCLDLRPREVVALVGPNGSGKTTLCNLIVGLYEPISGTVAIDGVEYRELEMGYLRRQIGVLTQDPVMVPGTVRENIMYGRPDVTDDEMARAIDLAGAGPMIAGLDAGLETRAYENGPLVSGGQLQRMALARALLGHPKLLILDEPSTHLDLDGVAAVLSGLRSFAEQPSMLIITHNPVVAAMADRVLRLDDGVLVPA